MIHITMQDVKFWVSLAGFITLVSVFSGLILGSFIHAGSDKETLEQDICEFERWARQSEAQN